MNIRRLESRRVGLKNEGYIVKMNGIKDSERLRLYDLLIDFTHEMIGWIRERETTRFESMQEVLRQFIDRWNTICHKSRWKGKANKCFLALCTQIVAADDTLPFDTRKTLYKACINAIKESGDVAPGIRLFRTQITDAIMQYTFPKFIKLSPKRAFEIIKSQSAIEFGQMPELEQHTLSFCNKHCKGEIEKQRRKV